MGHPAMQDQVFNSMGKRRRATKSDKHENRSGTLYRLLDKNCYFNLKSFFDKALNNTSASNLGKRLDEYAPDNGCFHPCYWESSEERRDT